MFGLGSNTQLGIGIAIRLHDQFSQQANQINNQLLKLRKNSQGALTSAAQSYRNQAAAIAAGAGAVSVALFRAAQDGAEFQHKINQAFIVGGKGLGKSRKELEEYSLGLSKQFTVAPTAIANTMLENAKAGVRDNLEEITKYQMAAAVAVGEPLEVVSEALLGAQHGYSIAARDFSMVANTMVAAANASMASVKDLGVSMEYAAFTAKRLKVPFQDLNVMFAMISQKGIKGSSAGTGVNNFLIEMAKSLGPFATERQTKVWKMLGLNTKKMAALVNSGRSLEAIMAVEKATSGMDPTMKVGMLNALFNRRGDRGLAAVLEGVFNNPNAKKTLSQIYNEVYSGQRNDIAVKQAGAMMNDLHSQMILASNAFFRVKNAVTHAIEPVLVVVLKAFTHLANVVEYVANSPLGKLFIGLIATMAPIIGVLFAFRAAALSATLAMRTMSMAGGTTSFGNLFRGMLGSVGTQGVLSAAQGALSMNKAGRLYVTGGKTLSMGTKILKGGSLIPYSLAGTNIFSSAAAGAAGAGAASAAGGLLSRALPWLTRIGGVALKFLPYLGWASMIYTVVDGIFGLTKSESVKRELDPMQRAYYRHLDEQFLGYSQSPNWYDNNDTSMLQKLKTANASSLQQQININVDGKLAMSQLIPQVIDQDMNSQLNYDVPF